MAKPHNQLYLYYFFNSFRLSAIILASGLIFCSCSITRPTYLFKDVKNDTIINGFTDADIVLKIQKNDLLSIIISSLNPAEDALFNASMGGNNSTGGYTVNLDGNIYVHKLGSVTVAGITRKELKAKLENDLLPYLKDPIVTVNFGNHAITVITDAGGGKILNMPAEKISVIDAIAQSGGNVGASGTFSNVLVIREEGTQKQFKHLNLENASIITSQWYYLQPKDILVLNPNEEKIFKDLKRARNQQILSTALSGLSIVLIIINLVLRK